MMNGTFSDNLRRLRTEKQITQEQAAQILGVSPQSVSRWECGNTYPDVMMLPHIARLYGVTVDDLYRADAVGYKSYAQRLLAVYEASGRTEDFLAAEQAFSKLGSGIDADDLRSWGVLYHYMMKRCSTLAQQKLEKAMTSAEPGDWVRYSAAQQRTALLCDLGRGQEAVRQYERERKVNGGEPENWLLCAAAHYFSGDAQGALEVSVEGIRRFPDRAALHIYAGDSCWELRRYEEAFHHWQRARELDDTYLDAVYSMAFCYEELGQFAQAADVWESLEKELLGRGLTVEAEFPAGQGKACRQKMDQ